MTNIQKLADISDKALFQELIDRDVLYAIPDRTTGGEWKIRFALDTGDDIQDVGDLDWVGPRYTAAAAYAIESGVEWDSGRIRGIIHEALGVDADPGRE